MNGDLVTTFSDSLAALGVGVTRTDRAAVPEAIADASRGGTIAAGLPPDSLPDGVNDEPAREELETARTGVTPAPLAVASYGSVLLRTTAAGEGSVGLFPPRHVAVVRADDVVADLGAALAELEAAFADGDDDWIFVTGTSATADMGELVEGVHGPIEMHVVVVDE